MEHRKCGSPSLSLVWEFPSHYERLKDQTIELDPLLSGLVFAHYAR